MVKLLRQQSPDWIILRIEDHYTSGIPDLSVTGNGRSSWYETKIATRETPNPRSKEQQQQTMRGLAREGFARYIIYDSSSGIYQVRIVHPNDFENWRTSGIARPGYNHQFVVDFIRTAHLS